VHNNSSINNSGLATTVDDNSERGKTLNMTGYHGND